MKLAVLAVFSIVGIVAGLAAETGLSADILKAIKGKEDLNRVSDYLERFSEGFNKDFPAVGADGKKAAYTFFFPTSFSFMRQLPQDVADPFFLDEEFRRSVFLRHVVRQSIAPKDLEKLNKLVMADSKEAVITREAGVQKINDAEILKDVIQLPNGAGTIYVIDRVFMNGDEVSQVLTKNAHKLTGFGPLGTPLSS